MRFARTLSSLALVGSLLLPSISSAHMVAPGKMAPIGFCAIHQDGTRGIRFDGVSYDAWFLAYALSNQEEVKRDLLRDHGGNQLLADQDFAMIKKAAAQFQRLNVSRGQQVTCN